VKKCCPTALAFSVQPLQHLIRNSCLLDAPGSSYVQAYEEHKTLAVLPGKGKGLTEIGMKSLV